jgi:phosphate transport system protein
MQKHLEREMEHLKKSVIDLGTLVESAVNDATRAFREMNSPLCESVISKDIEIDQMEIKVEEECLKMLALYQPVARDLRFIVTVLKINSDLERIGDLAVNIGKCAKFLSGMPRLDTQFHFSQIIQKTVLMLKKSLDSLVNMDSKLAYEVCSLDDEVDELKRQQELDITERIRNHPEEVESMLKFLSVSRYLERIADHATNISEDVIYSAAGDIIRHHHGKK